jgi:hypothetical protein
MVMPTLGTNKQIVGKVLLKKDFLASVAFEPQSLGNPLFFTTFLAF